MEEQRKVLEAVVVKTAVVLHLHLHLVEAAVVVEVMEVVKTAVVLLHRRPHILPLLPHTVLLPLPLHIQPLSPRILPLSPHTAPLLQATPRPPTTSPSPPTTAASRRRLWRLRFASQPSLIQNALLSLSKVSRLEKRRNV